MGVILGFNNSDGMIHTQVQYVVCFLRSFAEHKIALQADLAISDRCFHRNFTAAPLRGHGRSNVLKFYILLGHFLF